MLQIRLSKGSSSEAGGGAKPLAVDTVTVACPDHLVLADLPVAKSLGSATAASVVKTVGRRSRRQLGERVHFCVCCDFPIAIYGRLSPCEHAFCLDCARSDSICYLCDERIQKIQTIKMMEGIFICAAPHCLKSFLKKTDFESHVHEIHADLLHPNREKDVNESEAANAKKPANSDSTVQAPPRPVFSPSSDSQAHDQPPPRSVMQQKAMPPFFGQIQNHASDQQHDNFPPGLDRAAPQNSFPPGIETPRVLLQESTQFSDMQKGIPSETNYSEFPMHQPPGFSVPVNMNPVLAPPQFGYPPFASDGSEQGSLLSCPPGPASVNFPENYPRSWNMGPVGMPFEPSPAGQVNVDPQGRVAFFQGEYGRNPGVLPPTMSASPVRKEMDPMQAGNFIDSRDSKGILAPQPLTLPPPPPPLPHSRMSQHQRANFYSSDMSQDGQGYGWQHEGRDSIGSGQ